MILTERIITVNGNISTLDAPIYLYQGDKNVDIYFSIVNPKYKFSKKVVDNLLGETAAYFDLYIIKPDGSQVSFKNQAIEDKKAKWTIESELIDEEIEIGKYDFQIRLLDENKTSILTIPPLLGQLEILKPIYTDSDTPSNNLVNLAATNYALATSGNNDVVVFDEDGNYVATVWTDKMKITDTLLNKIETAIKQNTAQYKDIAKKVENVGQPTQEQINAAIDKAIKDGKLTGTGGINSTAKNLLQTILQNAVYTSNQSTNITALISALGNNEGGGGDTPTAKTYTITNNLTHCSNSNTSTSVNENSNYAATITPTESYTLTGANISITMGGVDITSTAYNNGTINIASVTGNIAITITATSSSSSSEMVTDGLVNYFDFRNAKYNNDGTGGSTIITATQGKGSLYTWAKNMVTEQNNYGMKMGRSMLYNANSVGTNNVPLGTSFTAIFKCYLTSSSSPLFTGEYAVLSNIHKLRYKPKYKTTSGTGTLDFNDLGTRLGNTYETVTLIVDDNICKLYFGTTLMQTNDGNTITDFQGWYDQLNGIGILGGNNNGYLTQMAVYNKALSEVQLVDMLDYLKTLEVSK